MDLGQHRLILASTSPRRRLLLKDAGFEVTICAPEVDDGELSPGSVSPEAWVMALAHLKAQSVAESGTWTPNDIVLAADTICAHEGDILGQPEDVEHARDMLRRMSNATHRTITGVGLLHPETGVRELFVDAAIVSIGDLSDEAIDIYVASNTWGGKAGAYNLSERLDAGWPIECDGDPTTVMGLPMRALPTWIDVFLASIAASNQESCA